MHLNDERVGEAEAGRLLNAVLDLGVNLIDTARSYGLSEERIGRHLAHRRQHFLLSTKVGYGVDGVPDWTYDCIVLGVERALRLMHTDVIDIVHLHSCPLIVLQQGEVTRALLDCQRAGKLRVAAYSGDNAELDFALHSGAFGSVQTSVSLCDQVNLSDRLGQAQQLASACWRSARSPVRSGASLNVPLMRLKPRTGSAGKPWTWMACALTWRLTNWRFASSRTSPASPARWSEPPASSACTATWPCSTTARCHPACKPSCASASCARPRPGLA